MTQPINANRLFLASCFALITTAFSFSIRAGILTQLGTELNLDPVQLGTINSMWFLGFPISMILGGIFYAKIGPKLIMQVAFVAHAIGILTTIYAGSYSVLLISTLLIGIGNGCTEAACNPMIADSYSGNEFHSKLNKFHMWFPGGIVIGSLVSKFMTDAGLPWQAQIWVILIPTIIYAVLFWGQTFPQPHENARSPMASFKAMLNPLYLFIAACMALTAISEFGPQQWVGPILAKAGASPMLILALVTGLMAVGRYFAGPLVQKLNTVGVLLGSAIFALIGIFMLSTMSGPMLYVAAVFYALGICYFWPNMLGFVGHYLPQTGALGLSIMGGIGMFSSSMFQPIIGGWIKSNKATAEAGGLAGDAADLAAGQATLTNMMIFPAILIVAFAILYVVTRKKQAATA
jgi:MFS transporter, putative metabolite:H+ symporter